MCIRLLAEPGNSRDATRESLAAHGKNGFLDSNVPLMFGSMLPLVILTGASGSGKTAIADAIDDGRAGFADVIRFDGIGVPSHQSTMAGWGSGEAWQRAMTLDWLARIATLRAASRPMLFEGQMRLAFVREGLLSAGISDARVLLVDCDDETRAHRLLTDRRQPELANSTMMKWAAFLRREARENGYDVLDTSHISLEASVAHVRTLLRGWDDSGDRA